MLTWWWCWWSATPWFTWWWWPDRLSIGVGDDVTTESAVLMLTWCWCCRQWWCWWSATPWFTWWWWSRIWWWWLDYHARQRCCRPFAAVTRHLSSKENDSAQVGAEPRVQWGQRTQPANTSTLTTWDSSTPPSRTSSTGIQQQKLSPIVTTRTTTIFNR